MKAAVVNAIGEPMTIEDVILAAPSDNQVQVKIAACAICQSDILYQKGGTGETPPMVLGHEASGVVEVVGPGVTNVKPGDHVVVTLIASCGCCHPCASGHQVLCENVFELDKNSPLSRADGSKIVQGMRTGAFAEYVTVNSSQVCAIPKHISLETACLLGCGVITGLGAVWNTAAIPAGANVAIIGLGGVGMSAVQGAAIAGANKIIGIDITEQKLDSAKSFGATHGFDATSAKLAAEVRDVTGGRGVDYVFVTVGAKPAIEQAPKMLAKRGSVVLVGLPDRRMKAEFNPYILAVLGQHIMGSKMGDCKVSIDIPNMISLYEQGRLKLDEMLSGRYTLDQINEAIESTASGEVLRNIVVM